MEGLDKNHSYMIILNCFVRHNLLHQTYIDYLLTQLIQTTFLLEKSFQLQSFPDATMIMYYMLVKANGLIKNLDVDTQRMADNIQLRLSAFNKRYQVSDKM